MSRPFNPAVRQPMTALSNGQSLKKAVAQYEIGIINDTLDASKSIREAAKKLKISHTALLNKLKKYDIEMVTKRTIGNKSDR
jgi:transcriptional regulator of aroF, aroG, tyrA and aromatic amino acid transport